MMYLTTQELKDFFVRDAGINYEGTAVTTVDFLFERWKAENNCEIIAHDGDTVIWKLVGANK